MSEPIKRPYGSRFRDTLVVVSPGACNPSGIALSIADACREMREHENGNTKRICQDPAIRLMVYQLASICGVSVLARGGKSGVSARRAQCPITWSSARA
jgi:hypothetical protein